MSGIAKHWIDGGWTGSGTISASVNPATGAVLGRWAEGGAVMNSLVTPDATAASYRKSGSWTIQTETGAELFRVRLRALRMVLRRAQTSRRSALP